MMPGEYLVQAEATGFQRYEQTVSLELGARSRLDMSLAVGSIGETVTVQGVTPLLICLGLFVAFLTMLASQPAIQRFFTRLDCRGPPARLLISV